MPVNNKDKTAFIVNAWYQGAWWLLLLAPLSFVYWLLISLRALLYKPGLKRIYRASVPVIVVGNITAGGTGKSPVVIALVKFCRNLGLKPGVVSRGYGSNASSYPFAVNTNTDPKQGGDEPVMIAQATNAPVVIGADRSLAIEQLIEQQCNIIIADDGLQHHAMARDIEIVVMDAARQLGNGLLLPMGPLREPKGRLQKVDFCIENGRKQTDSHYSMQLKPLQFVNIKTGAEIALQDFMASYQQVHAVTGIGNPQRFFTSLSDLGLSFTETTYPDHHAFSAVDIQYDDDLPVVMTAKDAVKVMHFSQDHYYYLAVEAEIESAFFQQFEQRLRTLLVE